MSEKLNNGKGSQKYIPTRFTPHNMPQQKLTTPTPPITVFAFPSYDILTSSDLDNERQLS